MNVPYLMTALWLFSAALAPVAAQARPSDPAVVAEARRSLALLDDGRASARDADALHRLLAQLENLRPAPDVRPSGEMKRLEDAERRLAADLPAGAAAPGTAAARDLGRVRAAFDAAYPDAASAPAASLGPDVAASRGALAKAETAATRAGTRTAVADPGLFYDGRAGANAEDFSRAGGGVIARSASRYHFTAVTPISDLRLAPVPAPVAAAPPPGGAILRDALDAARRGARQAESYAGRAAAYAKAVLLPAAKTGLQLAMLASPATAPLVLVPALRDAAAEFQKENTPTPESTRACLQAVAGTPFFASAVNATCRTAPAIAPLAAGLLDSVQQQFGTLSGLLQTAAYLLAGLLLGAMTGGIGLVVKILVAAGMTAYAAWHVVAELKQAIARYAEAKERSAQRYGALRSVGAVGGGLLLMAVMTLLGSGAAKTAVGARAAGSADSAATALVNKLGLQRLMTSVDAKLPWLAKLAESPGRDAEPTAVPRSAKSRLLFSDRTVLENAALKSRAARIDAAVKQLRVDRRFAEKVADAHDLVACAVGRCAPWQLRLKMEIMGRGRPAAEAIRRGLAGGEAPPKPAVDAASPAADGAPFLGDADLHRTPGALAPAAATTVRVTGDVVDHFEESGRIVRDYSKNGVEKSAKILGAHVASRLTQALVGQGRIVEVRPVPGLAGVSLVHYELLDAAGERYLPAQIKTVFDDARWSREEISALARSVFADEPVLGDHLVVSQGPVKFRGVVAKGTTTLKTFYIEVGDEP